MKALPCYPLVLFLTGALPIALPGNAEVEAGEAFVLRGGTVVDGIGASARRADVLVSGGRIVEVGKVAPLESVREIDVSGRVVAPGFIDTHAHGDPLRTPEFENFLRMGVTSISLGQDGSSPFADDLEAWREGVEAGGIGVNVAPFVGHGTVRRRSGVGINPDPSTEEIEEMAAMVERAMAAGAFGLTTGLEYQPGTFAQMEELVAIARPVALRDGLVMSHVRNEDEGDVLFAVDELLEQGRRAGARVHVSHIKTVFGRGPEPVAADGRRAGEGGAGDGGPLSLHC